MSTVFEGEGHSSSSSAPPTAETAGEPYDDYSDPEYYEVATSSPATHAHIGTGEDLDLSSRLDLSLGGGVDKHIITSVGEGGGEQTSSSSSSGSSSVSGTGHASVSISSSESGTSSSAPSISVSLCNLDGIFEYFLLL